MISSKKHIFLFLFLISLGAAIATIIILTLQVLPSHYISIFFTIYFLINVFLTLLVFISPINQNSIFAWTFFIWLIPVFGPLAYLVFGRVSFGKKNLLKKIQTKRKNELEHKNDIEKLNIPIQSKKMLVEIDNIISRKIYEKNKVELFSSAKKFDKLFEDLISAKKSIDIEYFIFHDGEVLQDFFKILKQKVQGGVLVRVLIDDFGIVQTKKSIFKDWIKAGIVFIKFNPVYAPYLSGYSQYRLHRKLVIIDNKILYLGGMNIGDEYSSLHEYYGDWIDLHLRIEGPVILDAKKHYNLDWLHATSIEKDTSKLDVKKNGNTLIQLIEDGKDVEQNTFQDIVIKLCKNSKKRIRICTPYNILPKAIQEALFEAASRNVEVEVILPGLPDKKTAFWIGKWYVDQMIRNGIKIYRTKNIFMHSKIMIFDEALTMVGTSNFDYRGLYLHFEINAFMYSKEVIKKLDAYVEDLKLHSFLQTLYYSKKSVLRPIRYFIVKMVSPGL